jgi:2-keto-4-pentenoate hydratase/2-oxohepta-3-ene-1,7-dioic acid hydratase in catechol pathway
MAIKRRSFFSQVGAFGALSAFGAGCAPSDEGPAAEGDAAEESAATLTGVNFGLPLPKVVGMVFNFPLPPGAPSPGPPTFFLRPWGSVTLDEDRPVILPTSLQGSGVSNHVNYEPELVIIMGRRAKNVSEADAAKYIFGYTAGMDGTPFLADAAGNRDVLRSVAFKSLDGFAPISKKVVKKLNPAGHDIVLRINGAELERTTTNLLIWGPHRIVAELSKLMTLEAGDLIFAGANRQIDGLRPGDSFEVEIPGVASVRRQIVSGDPVI